jgi:uncharacterized membrane protein
VIIINNSQLKELSKNQLNGNWKLPIIITLIYLLISIFISFVEGIVYSDILVAILTIISFMIGVWSTVGIPKFYLEFIKDNRKVQLTDALVSLQILGKSLLYNIIIGIITFIILIIAIGITVFSIDNTGILFFIRFIISMSIYVGFIILAIGWSQAPYIIVENNIGVIESMKISMKMMKGYKLKYFTLGLSFIGWAILSILTLGIGLLWLIPYINLTFANFYKDICEDFII